MPSNRLVLCATLFVMSSACGGSGDSTTIGPEGGTVTSSDGVAELSIPPGALRESVTIALTKIDKPANASPDIVDGTTYRIDGSGVTLAVPAELRLRFATTETQQALLAPIVDDQIQDRLICNGGNSSPVFSGLNPVQCYYKGTRASDCPSISPIAYDFVDPYTFGPVSAHYNGPAVGCGQSQTPSPLICAVDDFPCLLSHVNDSGQLVGAVGSLGGSYGVTKDKTPPSVSMTPSLTDAGDQSQLALVAVAVDNRQVVRVVFVRIDSRTVADDGSIDYQTTELASLDAPPFEWTSPPGSLDALVGKTYVAIAYDAAGNIGTDAKQVDLPKPVIASFTVTPSVLPVGGGSVTLAWNVSGADTVSIDPAIGGVQPVGTAVYSAAVTTTFTLTATNANGTSTAQVSVTVAKPDDIFVDATNGSDTNTGTEAAPFKRITKAAAVALPGTTIVLLDGTFNMASEGCTGTCNAPLMITLPDAVTVRAQHARAAILSSLGLNVANKSASFIDLRLEGFIAGIYESGATTGRTITLSGVQFAGGARLQLTGNSVATMVPGSLVGSYLDDATGFLAMGSSARLTITGGTLDGFDNGIPSYGGGLIAMNGTSGLVLDGVTVTRWKAAGIAINNTSTGPGTGVLLENGTTFDDVGGQGFPESSATIVTGGPTRITLDDAHILSSHIAGVSVRSGSLVELTIRNGSTMSGIGIANGNGFAIVNEDTTAGITLVVENSSITGNYRGMRLFAKGGMDIRGSHIDGNTQNAIELAQGAGAYAVNLRNTTVKANGGIGVFLNDHSVAQAFTLDLGTTANPGGNVFQNTGVGLKLDPPSVITVDAHGNSWQANVQNADNDGHYPDATSATGPVPTGENYIIVNGSTLNL